MSCNTLDRRVRTFGIQNDGDYQALNVNEYKPGFFEFDLKEWNKVTGISVWLCPATTTFTMRLPCVPSAASSV